MALARTLNLTSTDVLALDHIARRDDIAAGELRKLLMLSSGGTTAVIDRLVAAGLIARFPGTRRFRRVLLRVTGDGRSVTATPLAPLVADIANLASDLSPMERACVERFVARLADLAERHADRLATEANHARAAHVPSTGLWGLTREPGRYVSRSTRLRPIRSPSSRT